MQNKNLLRILIVGFIIFIVVFLLVLFFIIRPKTGFLTFNPPKGQIEDNNTNARSEDVLLELFPHIIYVDGNSGFPRDFLKDKKLNLPDEFEISVYAMNMQTPRGFDFDADDNIYITDRDPGKIYVLEDRDRDGTAEVNTLIEDKLRNPHGIDWYKGDLYVSPKNL